MHELFTIKYSELARIKKLPPRDQGHYLPFNTYPHGAPLGGFGAGTIGRSPYGDFNIWHIKPGAHISEEVKACCFHSYQRIINTENKYLNTLTTRPFNSNKLKKFAAPFTQDNGKYSASYPKSKYIFDEKDAPAVISCEQFSPILPNNYQETSYPLAVFEHTVKNKTNKEIEVSLMLSWANMTGWEFEDQRPGIQDNWFSFVKNNKNKEHSSFKKNIGKQSFSGVVLGQTKQKALQEMDGEFSIAALGSPDMQTTVQKYFYTEGTGEDLYKQFEKDGTLADQSPPHMLEHQSYGAGVAIKMILKPKEERKAYFFLAWDLPIVHFGNNVNKFKYYTRFFNNSGKNSLKLIQEAAEKHKVWSLKIDQWHQQIMENSKITKLIKNTRTLKNYYQMLINELYFLADGGSFWDAKTGSFGILECFDYPFYETLDVRFYGSFPLLKFWPEIELKIMEDFAKTINTEDKTMVRYHFHADNAALPLPDDPGEKILCYDKKKVKGACPHDLGSPKDNPFDKPAGYTWQNTNYWKDLNTKFILLIYRDFKRTKNLNFLKKSWPAMKEALHYLVKMDRDRDGIPENSGYPDQTYDNWIMHGISAYCGTLWLAALQAMISAAGTLKDKTEAEKCKTLLTKAKQSFDKELWNKRYYNFCSDNNDIMADQLIGQWYIDILKENAILPEDKIRRSLKTIFKYNYKKTVKGKWGIVSGKKRNNRMVDAEQGRDVWVGANFSLCTLFLHHGMPKAAEQVLNTMSHVIYDKGFFFRTPEGWDTKGHFTATMYMRPNAIWAMEF